MGQGILHHDGSLPIILDGEHVSVYLLNEDRSKILLEDGSGALLIEQGLDIEYWPGNIGRDHRYKLRPHSFIVRESNAW